LVLETNNMSAIVTMETWILSASAKLGGIELLDHLNKGKKFLGFLLFVRNNNGNEKIRNRYKIESVIDSYFSLLIPNRSQQRLI